MVGLLTPAPLIAGAFIYSSTPGVTIPDNSDLGITDTINVSFPANHTVTGLRVSLDISGGYNGDLYAYLFHDDAKGFGFSVLLNRSGRTESDPYGYPDIGYNITFADSASADIHLYRLTMNPDGDVLTGVWQPDARAVSPYEVFDTSQRSAFLGSFLGRDPRGAWTLFVADVSPIGVSTLNSWSIEIVTAPEPSSLACAAVMGIAAIMYRYCRRNNTPK